MRLQRAAAAPGQAIPTTSDMPTSLFRRYEVHIIPRSDLTPKKLREIRAAGESAFIRAFYMSSSSLMSLRFIRHRPLG